MSNRNLRCLFKTYLIKKVSWASLAGCCWGWNNASKFQKELSTKLLVGISENPISRNIWRYSARTFRRGCRCPVGGWMPRASKLYGLKFAVFQSPLAIISAVNSVAAFSTFVVKFSPLVSTYLEFQKMVLIVDFSVHWQF